MAIGSKKFWTGFAAAFAAIGASVCCVGPLLLLSLGIGGAWMSTLTSLESTRPVFFILTLIFIGLGYRQLYLVPKNCDEDQLCASEQVLSKQKLIFWIGSFFILLLLAFPWYAPYFME